MLLHHVINSKRGHLWDSGWQTQKALAFSSTWNVSQFKSWAAAMLSFASHFGFDPRAVLYTVEKPNSLAANCVTLDRSPWEAGRRVRALLFGRIAERRLYVINSHLREKEREQGGSGGRKCNIGRLPAAAQWSGIKKTCYLNCKEKCSRQSVFGAYHQVPKVALSAFSTPYSPLFLKTHREPQ